MRRGTALVLFAACLSLKNTVGVPIVSTSVTLRDLAWRHGLLMGAATNAGILQSEAQYKAVAAAQYSLTTAENSCKVAVGCHTSFTSAD